MNEAHSAAPASLIESGSTGINLLNMMIGLARHKKLIVALPIAVALLVGGVSLLLPDVYKATSKLLPPQQPQSGAAALLSQLGGPVGAVGGLKSPTDLYIGMLKSRTVADKLIEKYELKKVYGTGSMEKARRLLETKTTIAAGKDGLITIDVEDEDRQRVASLTNSYVDELMRLTRTLAVTEAAQRRMFFERQLELSKNNLAKAEMTLKGSLDTQGVINVDSDSRAIAVTVARWRAQISAKEVELGAMSAFVTPNNQEYKRTEEELRSARAELSRLENGRPLAPGGDSAGGVKAPGLANIQTLRDVKYYQMLYEMLAKQYEMARLDEAKDAALIQVLDIAIEPEKKFKPKRALMVIMAGVLALFAAIGLAYLAELRDTTLCHPEGRARWNKFVAAIRFK